MPTANLLAAASGDYLADQVLDAGDLGAVGGEVAIAKGGLRLLIGVICLAGEIGDRAGSADGPWGGRG